MARKRSDTSHPPPFLKRVRLPERDEQEWPDWVDWEQYPLNLSLIQNAGLDIQFDNPVTIIVGENGSGKSSVLEAVAQASDLRLPLYAVCLRKIVAERNIRRNEDTRLK